MKAPRIARGELPARAGGIGRLKVFAIDRPIDKRCMDQVAGQAMACPVTLTAPAPARQTSNSSLSRVGGRSMVVSRHFLPVGIRNSEVRTWGDCFVEKVGPASR